ncbi:DNA-packaging protein [Qipengyuania sp. DSG2-2]|uniref:DNA-packaging protein n=1 Tax=Qipengyuania sp. DGS2-2 TaxID=3349631 RepID=UPI0036D2C60A
MTDNKSRGELYAEATPAEKLSFIRTLNQDERNGFNSDFSNFAHEGQRPPSQKWATWLMMAGRGFGKTRAGSEWVSNIAINHPSARIALVAASLGEARAVMVEGDSGLIAVASPGCVPVFEPSLRRLRWPGGAQAQLFSAAEPESLRGPQHSHAWCDELAKWDNSSNRALRCWDNLQLGLRLGDMPQTVVTTTPRAVPVVQRLVDEAQTAEAAIAITGGSTLDNAANLSANFLTAVYRQFGGSALGRQELEGELLRDVEGALWSRTLLERCRSDVPPAMVRLVVAVDPPASARGDACGIVVAGVDAGGNAAILADATVEKASPERWARAVADTASLWGADRVVAEANQGGAMVESVLRAADISLPVKLVHASRGKSARAEPVAALYEAGRVQHSGLFGPLEDQLCGLMTGGSYEGPGRSPDRADALVWALTELMLGKQGAPRVQVF